MLDNVRDPAEIYRRSFEAIKSEVELERFNSDLRPVITRMVHACGVPEIAGKIEASDQAVNRGKAALSAGATVYCDVEMVRHGIIKKYLPAENPVLCSLMKSGVPDHAKSIGNTRSAAAIDYWDANLEGSIVIIGNAPTALFYLLEKLDGGAPRPALIIGMPVGFVGAEESKRELSLQPRGCEFITLHGRMGGSAIAASAFNAISGGLAHG